MILATTTGLNKTLPNNHYAITYEAMKDNEPVKSTLEYNYITTEKFIEEILLKHQDILQSEEIK